MASYTIKKKHGSINIQARYGSWEYIAVHYVGAGTSASGSAKANCIFFSNAYRGASAHYFIDDFNIYEFADPSKYITWHVGDGYGKYGMTNANTIGIEVCISGNKPFTKREQDRLEWLVKYLMKKYNIKASKVKRHYDASRKLCPLYYTRSEQSWKTLHKKITGTATTPKKAVNPLPYKVEIICDSLNVRTGPGVSYKATGIKVKKGEVYTIVTEQKPNTVKWGKLKSGAGWISLGSKYIKKV